MKIFKILFGILMLVFGGATLLFAFYFFFEEDETMIIAYASLLIVFCISLIFVFCGIFEIVNSDKEKKDEWVYTFYGNGWANG